MLQPGSEAWHEENQRLRLGPPVPRRAVFDAATRAIDFVLSLLLLVLLAPLWLVVSILICGSDRGPVLYRQKRLGHQGRTFEMAKFRTMVVGADRIGSKLRLASGDPRVTRIGRILRRLHIDEIPQLLNVLRGDMGWIGPRPALPFHRDYYEPWEMARLAVRPGMTGLAQVCGGNAIGWDARIEIDVYYVHHRGFLMNLAIIGKTLAHLAGGHGVAKADGSVRGWTRPVPQEYADDQDTLAASASESADTEEGSHGQQ